MRTAARAEGGALETTICQVSPANVSAHAYGRTMAECERNARKIESGGAGRLLAAVHSDHHAQLSREKEQAGGYPGEGYLTPSEGAKREQERRAAVELVNHPGHYGGDTAHEVIKCLEAWGLDSDAYLFNVVKYIARPGKGNYLEDLKKARWYLDRKISRMEEGK